MKETATAVVAGMIGGAIAAFLLVQFNVRIGTPKG